MKKVWGKFAGEFGDHYREVMKHLYISPLEACNLACKICYTKKTGERLSYETMIDFIKRYAQVVDLETVTFCGGEVFLLPDFTKLVNQVTEKYLVQVITNGMVDKLEEIERPNSVNLIVSLDGLPEYHDRNRGEGNWQKSVEFLKKAKKLGFFVEVFSIVTEENLADVEQFEKLLSKKLGGAVAVTYHPRKPMTYLKNHPVSNVVGAVKGFGFISNEERLELSKTRKIFPPLTLGCYQVSVMSDGKVYGCCEGIRALGKMEDDVEVLVEKMEERLMEWRKLWSKYPQLLGCVEPEFVCGYKSDYQLENSAREK